ncbi:uncharacterized protein KZ484_008291 isoform 2-T2 [Pholidichthys leucotaenia]
MRRFFKAHRDEDYSQIQYLTAKCTRLAHDKAVLEREFLVSGERERKLQNDLEAAAARLLQQEQHNEELRANQTQLISRIHQQQDLMNLLRQRLVLLAEVSSRDAEMLRQIGSELLCLQSSEVKLEGLVEELHTEAQHRAAVAKSLQAELHIQAQHKATLTDKLHAELHSKTMELDELQEANKILREELKELRKAHQKEVRELQRENEGSLRKLQETAEQFEWLCQQQRYWMSCVKRFKDCLMEERKALLRQVSVLEKNSEKLQKNSCDGSPSLEKTECSDCVPSWDVDAVVDMESQVEKSNLLYEELVEKAGSPINGHQKPP